MNTLVVSHLDFENNNIEDYDDEEDLMYGANNYGEAPVPEQLESGRVTMDIDEPDHSQEAENDLH